MITFLYIVFKLKLTKSLISIFLSKKKLFGNELSDFFAKHPQKNLQGISSDPQFSLSKAISP